MMSEYDSHYVVDRTSIQSLGSYEVEERKRTGTQITHSCMLNYDHRIARPTILWYKDVSELVEPSDTFTLGENNQTLSFKLSTLNQGNYSCKVNSTAGSATKSFQITALEVPHPPQAVAVLSANRSINISWTPPFNGNSIITDYIIRVRETSTGEVL